MTEFKDIQKFMQSLENSKLEERTADGIKNTGENKLEKEINRLQSIDKDELFEENRKRLDSRLTALKQVRDGEI